jgi:hypothetical protein
MTTLREAAQQALEALKCLVETHEMGNTIRADIVDAEEAIDALKAALEQPEQEPVSTWYGTDWPAHMQLMAQLAHLEPGTDLYTHPPRREWRGLTEEEINDAVNQELLEALKRLHDATWLVSRGHYNEELHDIAVSKARAVIAKAEGTA